MNLTERWQSEAKPTISFEFYPARDGKTEKRLNKALGRLAEEKPDFVSVTFGAGGSNREGSRQLVQKLMEMDLHVLAYFAGYGLGPNDVCSILDAYQDMGVQNILTVRGDTPHGDDSFTPHPDSFAHASELIAFVGEKYRFCLGAAGHPEGHIDAESRERDLQFHKLKVDNGAEFIITNYTYDTTFYFDFVKSARALGIQVPILPGIMPIWSVKMMENMAKLCGASIPDKLRQGLAALPEEKNAVGDFGIEYGFRQCKELLEAGVPGIHFYTLDRSKATVGILQKLRAEGLL